MANGTAGILRGVLDLPDCSGRPTCDPTPVCPACGGLECLCRPRFFAGQLLTDEDLNRLDHYMQAKNRLHNRHLHGWGVACGLEVVCGVCEPDQGRVVVKPGYALSPCGNDIVVCRNETVDICDLINRCRPPADDCDDLTTPERPVPSTPPPPPPQDTPGMEAVVISGERPGIFDSGEGTQEWVLAVCYTEKPSRGRAALRANVCDCGCGCGGHGNTDSDCGCGSRSTHEHGTGGNCGCGDSKSRRNVKAKTPRSIPEQCEPTVTCEGYRFVVYRKPRQTARDRYGAAARRFLCCVEPFLRELDGDRTGTMVEDKQQWVVSYRDSVREFVINEGLYDCDIARRLAAIVVPDVSGHNAETAVQLLNRAAVSITAVAAVIMQKCYCAALLPPCPEPSQTDCVPLATVSVTRGTCRVVKVCNLSARKFLVTLPNIGYWLSFINLFTGSKKSTGSSLRDLLVRFCCRSFSKFEGGIKIANFFDREAPAGAASETFAFTDTGNAPRSEGTFASLLWNAVAQQERQVGVEHVLLGALDARDAAGRPFLSKEELANPSELLTLNQVVAPLLRAVVPSWGAAAAAAGRGGYGPPASDDLRDEVASLRETIDEQRRRIEELERRG